MWANTAKLLLSSSSSVRRATDWIDISIYEVPQIYILNEIKIFRLYILYYLYKEFSGYFKINADTNGLKSIK